MFRISAAHKGDIYYLSCHPLSILQYNMLKRVNIGRAGHVPNIVKVS